MTTLGSPYVMIDREQAAALMPELSFTIDWAELGRLFSKQGSPEQADFLVAFFESTGDAQLAFIGGEKIFDAGDPRRDKAQFFRDLAHFIDGSSE